jgi:hypothetical protein
VSYIPYVSPIAGSIFPAHTKAVAVLRQFEVDSAWKEVLIGDTLSTAWCFGNRLCDYTRTLSTNRQEHSYDGAGYDARCCLDVL